MPKTTNQLIIESMAGKLIVEAKVSDSGVIYFVLKTGEKFSFTLNNSQGIAYSSVKPKPKNDEKVGKLVKASAKLLGEKEKPKRTRKNAIQQ